MKKQPHNFVEDDSLADYSQHTKSPNGSNTLSGVQEDKNADTFCLDTKIIFVMNEDIPEGVIRTKYIRKFIRLLKEYIRQHSYADDFYKSQLFEEIDKLAGEQLTK